MSTLFCSRTMPAISFVVLASLSALLPVLAEDCLPYDNQGSCKCQLASNPAMGLDLTPIKSQFANKQVSYTGIEYAWGPCGEELDFSPDCSPDNKAAACRGPDPEQPRGLWSSLGTETSAKFKVDITGEQVTTIVTYTGGSGGSSSTFTLICNETSNGTFEYLGQLEQLYMFEITSNATCLVAVTAPSGGSNGSKLSPGSILLIILAVAGIVYFVGGVAYQRFVRGARGAEMIPNRDGWMRIPDFILDGSLFVISPCRGKDDDSRSRIDYKPIV